MKAESVIYSLGIALVAIAVVEAQLPSPSPTTNSVPVTADNFIRAESDKAFADFEKQGGFGKLLHFRELAAVDNHTVKRGNRDTLYSVGVFDLDAGQVTISLPDAGKRFIGHVRRREPHSVT
jgi:hypothetical protein